MIKTGGFIAVIGFACLLAFRLIGSHVGMDGFVQEPFALLPIGYLLVFAGMLIGVSGFIRRLVARQRQEKA